MKNAKISIIIPTRNEAKYIGGAIEQFVPHLCGLDLEIIVSDAHSIDGTVQIVRDFAQKHPDSVRLVQAPGKQNIAVGRNFGAAHASGGLLFHTDADVRLPDVTSFCARARRLFESETSAATGPIWVYPQESKWNDRAYHWLMNTTVRASCTLGINLAKGECQLVRRLDFEAVGGYDERLVAGEDCNLFYRLRQRGNVAFDPMLRVWHSPRRFRQRGYARVSFDYFLEGVWRLFFGKSFAREWKMAR